MAGLPEPILEVVCSPAVHHCEVRNCMDCMPYKLGKRDFKIILDAVPYPTGKSKYETTWERKKVQTDLKHALEGLGPRFWRHDTVKDIAELTASYPWYSR